MQSCAPPDQKQPAYIASGFAYYVKLHGVFALKSVIVPVGILRSNGARFTQLFFLLYIGRVAMAGVIAADGFRPKLWYSFLLDALSIRCYNYNKILCSCRKNEMSTSKTKSTKKS